MDQAQQADLKSTWRQRDIVINGGDIETIDFPDTRPNHVYINNLSPNKLYLGVRTIPSVSNYELDIDSQGYELHAQDQPMTRCMIFNSGTLPARIIVTSFEKEFNPAALTGRSRLTGGSGGDGGNYDGIIRGFSVALPPGNNNLGKVVVTEMPPISVGLEELPPGTNNIGKVEVTKLPPLPAGESKIGNVSIEGGLTITSMPPVQIENSETPVRQSHQYFESDVGTQEVVFDMLGENIYEIVFLANDGGNDLFVSFDDEPATTTIVNGKSKTIRLKAGESIADLGRLCYKVRFIRSGGLAPVRFMGV